jgi:hypothetical protein
MKSPRVSILGLIAGVVACGVAFAALRLGSDYWLSAFYTMTVALLLFAVVAARYRRGTSRAFWFGFAVFGWGMFLLGSNPWMPRSGFDGEFSNDINPNLLTTRLIQFVVVKIRMGTDDLQRINQISANTIGIVHLMAVLAVGTVGGLLAVAMKKRGRRIAAQPDPARRSNVLPSVVILVSLTFAGMGALDRKSTTYILDKKMALKGNGFGSRIKWYLRPLQAADEPSLLSLSRRDHQAVVFRFLWLPSFDHSVCVRVFKENGRARLRATVLDGQGGSGQVAIDKTIELGEDQWKDLERHLETAAFWKMPTQDPSDPGTDGDRCIVEGVKSGLYPVVDRHEPDPAYTALCRSMLDLTGLQTQEAWDGYHQVEPMP